MTHRSTVAGRILAGAVVALVGLLVWFSGKGAFKNQATITLKPLATVQSAGANVSRAPVKRKAGSAQLRKYIHAADEKMDQSLRAMRSFKENQAQLEANPALLQSKDWQATQKAALAGLAIGYETFKEMPKAPPEARELHAILREMLLKEYNFADGYGKTLGKTDTARMAEIAVRSSDLNQDHERFEVALADLDARYSLEEQ